MADHENGYFPVGRLEAFSDGVIAIDITLLVFNLQLPEIGAGESLLAALAAQWPEFAAFFVSFVVIGVMWVNHHNLFCIITRTDHILLLLNGLLLLGITFVPFPTRLMANYLRTEQSNEAAIIYAGTFLVIAFFFQLLWRYAVRNNHLTDMPLTPQLVRKINRNYNIGFVLYGVALAAAFVSAQLAMLITLILAIFFALPQKVAE
jgi:uncharacterized membrane protein